MKLFLAVLTIVTFLGFAETAFADSTILISTPGSVGLCIRQAEGVITCR